MLLSNCLFEKVKESSEKLPQTPPEKILSLGINVTSMCKGCEENFQTVEGCKRQIG